MKVIITQVMNMEEDQFLEPSKELDLLKRINYRGRRRIPHSRAIFQMGTDKGSIEFKKSRRRGVAVEVNAIALIVPISHEVFEWCLSRGYAMKSGHPASER